MPRSNRKSRKAEGTDLLSLKCCPSCGTIAYPDDLHCSYCGGLLESSLQEPEEERKPLCRQCGEINNHPQGFFCSGCGSRLQ